MIWRLFLRFKDSVKRVGAIDNAVKLGVVKYEDDFLSFIVECKFVGN